MPWHLTHEVVEDTILYVEIIFQKHNDHQTNENGGIKVPAYIKNYLRDLLSGMFYKNHLFEEICSKIADSQGIQTPLKGKTFAQNQIGNTKQTQRHCWQFFVS